MHTVFLKAGTFLFLTFLGYFIKRIGLVRKEDSRVLSKIIMNITLPCAIIASFGQANRDFSLLILPVISIVACLFMAGTGVLITRRKDDADKAYYILCLPAYNIGNFTLPFVQGLLSPNAVVGCCMFDMGNAIMCTGLDNSIAMLDQASSKNGDHHGETFRRLLSSVSFDVYIVLLFMMLCDIPVPGTVREVTSLIGQANSIISMLMLGIMIEFRIDRKKLPKILIVLSIRICFAALLSVCMYRLLPFPQEIRKAVAICAWAPCSSVSAAFVQELNGDYALASLTNTMSVLVSLLVIPLLLVSL